MSPRSPDDSCALVEFSSPGSVALRTTPGALATPWSVVTMSLMQRPPRLLNVSSVSPLAQLHASPFCASWECHFPCPCGFLVGNTGSFSLVSSCPPPSSTAAK